jgi:2-polyprenyl-3-methyl-5-hydroxy-6-metoxy-1,4-benzoquinol methylase
VKVKRFNPRISVKENEDSIMTVKMSKLDGRIPHWELDDLRKRACPICRKPESSPTYLRPDGLQVLKCSQCSTYFISPAPSEEQLNRFYEKYDENHRREPSKSIEELRSEYEHVDPLTDLRIKELVSLMELNDSRVLDIGFGRGQFLFRLKQLGARPHGMELDEKALEYAQQLGIEAFCGSITEYEGQEQFDLISMLDLVEHPLEPMEFFRSAAELLKTGGYLLFWTPNGDYANSENEPATFRVDLEHMQYFTPDSCMYIAQALDLRIVHLETYGYPNLKGIDGKGVKEPRKNIVNKIKRKLKTIPGLSAIRNPFRKEGSSCADNRTGTYHLFCIMQKRT